MERRNLRPLLYGFFFLLIAFMHIYLIDRLPRGLNVDEVGSAYDAYCLGKFGVDRWRKSWPLYLMNYRDGQNILYTYLLVPVFLLFGTSVYTIRSVIIVSAFVMAFFGMRLAKEIFDRADAGLLFLGIFAVVPVFTMTLRFGLESHLLMALSSIILYEITAAVKKGRKRDFFLLGIISGLSLYSYAIAYLIVPLFLFLSLIYLMIKRKVSAKSFLLTAIPFLIMAIPLAAVQIVNIFDLPEMQIGIFTLTKLSKYRSGELTLSGFFAKILKAGFHTCFYDNVSYNSTPKFGNFYYISVPFILIGAVWSVWRSFTSLRKDREYDPAVFPLLWAGCCYLVAGFMHTAPGYTNLTRMNGVLISLAVFLTEGIYMLPHLVKLKEKLKELLGILLAGVYAVLFLCFAMYYFGPYDGDAYPYQWLFFEEYDKDALAFLEDPEQGYSEAPVYLPFVYTYYLWSTKISPYDAMIAIEENGSDPDRIGRYSMAQGHNLNGEYLFYRYGFSQPEIDLFRNWHFVEREMGSFVLMTDPLGNPPFFGENYEISEKVTLTKAYLDAIDEETARLYGWLLLDASCEGAVEITLECDAREITIKSEVTEKENGERECFFLFDKMDYEEFYQSSRKNFLVMGKDPDGRVLWQAECEM